MTILMAGQPVKPHPSDNKRMLIKNVLIVCTGNICRSPMAEGLFKHSLAVANKPGCVISSAGLAALVGRPPDASACRIMRKQNIDISSYRARQLNKSMIRKADLVLVMETLQKLAIEEIDISAKGKIFRLGNWGRYNIPDPYQQDLSAFEVAYKLIEQGVSDWLPKLQ